MRFVPLDHLKENEILAENILNNNNQILLKKNVQMNPKNIERIKALGFKSLYIKNKEDEEIFDSDVQDIISPEIRKRAIADTEDCMNTFLTKISKQKQQMIFGDSGQNFIKSLDDISTNLIDEILNSNNLTVSIMDIKTENFYLYEHAINTAVLSILLSVKIGLSMRDMRNIGIAALLLNLGYKNIPNELYDHPDSLSEDAREEIIKHPFYSYELLTNNTNLNAHIKSIVIQHHERLDGSGYPQGLKSEEIHPHAKIVMLADVYDAMTSDRKHRYAYPHNEVVEYIMGNAGKLFDFDLANTFCRCIIPYPAGSYVMLSNGMKAVILKNNPSHPLRPVVRIFKKNKLDTSDEGLINLLEKHNLTINKLIYE